MPRLICSDIEHFISIVVCCYYRTLARVTWVCCQVILTVQMYIGHIDIKFYSHYDDG